MPPQLTTSFRQRNPATSSSLNYNHSTPLSLAVPNRRAGQSRASTARLDGPHRDNEDHPVGRTRSLNSCGDFYFRAFNGSVTLPVPGYDYGGNWTISAGLARAGPTTSVAAQLPPPHSITSSASASNLSGTLRPSAFAVFRLITSSNLVGPCTGNWPGFSPRRMRST
jgi:hypothetical protein